MKQAAAAARVIVLRLLLLPLLSWLLTAGSLGCTAADLPPSGSVAAVVVEQGQTVRPSAIQHFSAGKNGTARLRRDVPPSVSLRLPPPSAREAETLLHQGCSTARHSLDVPPSVSLWLPPPSAREAETLLHQMDRSSSNPHFSVKKSGTARRSLDVVSLPEGDVIFDDRGRTPHRRCGVPRKQGLSSTQETAEQTSPTAEEQAGALEQLTRQKTRQLWEEHLSDALPQTAREQLEDLCGQPSDFQRWDFKEVWQRLSALIQQKLRELLREPLRLLGTLIGTVVLCAVLGAMQSAQAQGMQEVFGVVAAASALVLLAEPVLGCVERTVQSLRECSLFVMSFAPVLSGILIAGGNPASAGAYNLMLYFVSQLLAELASKTLLPLLSVYLALCILSPLAPFLQIGQLTRAIHRLTCWGLGVLTTLFVAILSLQTVIGSGGDGILLKTSKFLVGSFVPVIGGTLSDAMGAAASCLRLMKGLVGSLGMAVAVLTFLPVLIEVTGWYLTLHTAAWAAQMLDCSRMSGVLRSVASAFSILLALVVCFGLLVLVSTTMVLSVGVA